ncbi:hypothetical protein NBRC116584_32630 [Hydrogenophaga sp. 5NK40-0174]
MVGVWTCMYCEGAWLPSRSAQRVLSAGDQKLAPCQAEAMSMHTGSPIASLRCPECESGVFATVGEDKRTLFCCSQCGSVYLPRAAVAQLSSRLGGGRWNIAEIVAHAMGGRTLSGADGGVAVVVLLYLLLS